MSEPLSGLDTWWLRAEDPGRPLLIVTVMRLAQAVDERRIDQWIATRFVSMARLRQRVVHTRWRRYWQLDPQFDLANHVRTVRLDREDEAGLTGLVDREIEGPLRPDHPLWRMVKLVDEDGNVHGLVTSLHHCLADGFSLLRLLANLVDQDTPLQLPVGNKPSAPTKPPRSTLATTLATMLATIKRLLLMGPDSRTTLSSTGSGHTRVGWSKMLKVEDVKRIAKAHNATINDVLLACLAGAFARLLAARGEQATIESLRIVVPVNLAPFDLRRDSLGNGFGLVYVELPVGIRALPKRIDALKRQMDRLKRSPEAWLIAGVERLFGHLPGAAQAKFLALFSGKTTAAVTNMPGPTQRVKIVGTEIDDVVFFIPQSGGSRIGVSLFSYAGRVVMSVAADSTVMTSGDELVVAFAQELIDANQDGPRLTPERTRL